MNTMHDLEATTYAPTGYAPRGDDATVASAWSSSPLGNPAHDAGYADQAAYPVDSYYVPDSPDFAADPTTVTRRPKFVSKGVLAAGLIATIGVGAALTFALSANLSQPRPVAVAAPSTSAPVAAPAAAVQPPPASVPAPAPVADVPANIPAPAPVVEQPVNIPAPAPVVTPPPDNGPPHPIPAPRPRPRPPARSSS